MAQRVFAYLQRLLLFIALGLLALPIGAKRSAPPPPQPQPRATLLLDAGWKAALEKSGASQIEWAKQLPEGQAFTLPFSWDHHALTREGDGALWCAREITFPAEAPGGVQLVIDNAVGVLDVYLDGQAAAHLLGNGLPRRIPLTGKAGSTHYLALRLDRAALPEALRRNAFAGMGPITLETLPLASIDSLNTQTNGAKKTLSVRYHLATGSPGPARLQIELLKPPSPRPVVREIVSVDIPRAGLTGERTLSIKKLARWSPAAPALYRLRVTLLGPGKSSDIRELPFGVCDFALARRAFTINNKPLLLKGLRLPGGIPPLSKPSLTQTLEEELALVKKAGFNAIMADGAALPEDALAIADRLGLLVIGEIPLEQEGAAAPARRELAVASMGAHPSVVAWSWSGQNAPADALARLRAIDPVRLVLLRDSDPSRIIAGSGSGEAFINLDVQLPVPVPTTWPGWEILRQAKTGDLPVLLCGIGLQDSPVVACPPDARTPPSCASELREIIERLRTAAHPLGYFVRPLPGDTLTGLSGAANCLSQTFTAALSFNNPCMVAARVKPGARPADASQIEAAIINDQGLKGPYELYQLLTGPDGGTKIIRKAFTLSGERIQDVSRLLVLPTERPGDYALNLLLSKQAVVIAGDQLTLTIPVSGREK
ncbi:MAG: glycoside hydrolase family 2 protein [Armatimonadota bacterium]